MPREVAALDSTGSQRRLEAREKAQVLRKGTGPFWDYLLEAWSSVNCKSSQSIRRGAIDHFFEIICRCFPKEALHQVFPDLAQYNYKYGHTPSSCIEAVEAFLSRVEQSPGDVNGDEGLVNVLEALPVLKTRNLKQDRLVDSLRSTLAAGFLRPYKGDAPKRLLRFAVSVNDLLFEKSNRFLEPDYKGTHIVQSRGTGKTRMVVELGRIAPLLYLCIRKQSDAVDTAYPLGDKPIIDLITKSFEVTNPFNYDEIAAIVLGAWFSQIADTLEKMTIAQDKFSYMVALNHFGSEAHESSRKVFLQQIVGRAEAIFDAGPLRDQKPGSTFQHYLDGPVERLSKQLQLIQQHLHPSADVDAPVFVAFDDYAAWPEKFIHSIRRAWAHITELKTRLSAKDCKEEGSNETLGEECTTQASSKPYIACFWLLLISSSTSAATRDQPGTYRSDQNQIRPVSLPVFIASSFDVLCSGSQAVHHASEVATKSYISMMGRPLWASLFDESFWAVAVRTLLGSDSFNRCSDISCFNVLATRLALDFVQATINDDGPIRNQVEFAGKSVDVHMRILDKLDNHAVLHIRAPSEPVLAIAASLLMMPTREDTIPDARSEGMPKTRYGCILQVVGGRCLTSTNIDVLRDNRGGLATKLVLMTAWDAAKQVGNSFKRLEDIEKQASHLLQPVLLDAIIDGLIKLEGNQAADIRVSIQSICEKVRTQCPDHANAQAWAHHTHFDVLKDPVRDLSPEYLWYCWKRGVAIQMAPDQLGVDGIIPIFVGDLTRPFANLTTQQMDTDAARGAEGDETWAACHMTYIAWKGEAQSSSEDFETALRNPVTAGPLLRYARIQDDALTRRGILTVWTDLSAKDKPAKLDVVADADKPMLLIQGVAQKEPRNYPCLDTLRIRSVATRFIKDVVSGRKDYEKQNRMHDPVSLRTLDAALAGEPGDAEETCAPVDLDIIFRPLVGDTPDESTPSEPMEPGDLRL